MSPPFPSIQSFFRPLTPPTSTAKDPNTAPHTASTIGDGFTARSPDHDDHHDHDGGEPPSSALPTADPPGWTPRHTYSPRSIGALVAGPQAVVVTGRIVNLYEQQMQTNKRPKAAQGLMRIVVRDETGALVVKLYYADPDEYAHLKLGQRCTLWTPHVSRGDGDLLSMTAAAAPLYTSIFPERDRSCFFRVLVEEEDEEDGDDDGARCRTPWGELRQDQDPDQERQRQHQQQQPQQQALRHLMNINELINGGHEVVNARIIVCVKSIGPRKKYTSKSNKVVQKVDVGVFDHTAEVTLTLWGIASRSVVVWKPSATILLLTRPRWNVRGGGVGGNGTLVLTAATQVDVDPGVAEAAWLRAFAAQMTKRGGLVRRYPNEVYDMDAPLDEQDRVLFTLADVEEICGVPLYANALHGICKNCEHEVSLSLNPRIIGTLLDETGCIPGHKLIWSVRAWTQLLGRSPAALVACEPGEVRDLQAYLRGLRLALVWGWVPPPSGLLLGVGVGAEAEGHVPGQGEETKGEGERGEEQAEGDVDGERKVHGAVPVGVVARGERGGRERGRGLGSGPGRATPAAAGGQLVIRQVMQ
ncbi:MAG: hypothetical protein M1826_004250 [Phylliscum demangeonii]|nr:MAG: hypothetical protein M1826_004250 [Phylliscum demangeonii]